MTSVEKLRAAEKLLSRLPERKKSIIEHVKQQAELYSQHLASKLLIEGIDPPSWLRDPSTSGSKELNEEDFISKLLRQYPQQSAPCSVARYPGNNNSVITGDHEIFSDGVLPDNPESNKHLGQYAIKMAPEVDTSAASAEDQTDERILGIYSVPEQSLAGIQRSKSRQKALELRSSAKAQAKSGLRHASINDAASSQIRFSLSISNQPGQNDELSRLGEELCSTDCQSFENRNVVEGHSLSREMGADVHPERIIRSGTYAEVPISEDSKENASNQVARVRRKESMSIRDTENDENHINKSPKSTGPSPDCYETREMNNPSLQQRSRLRDTGEEGANKLCKDDEKNVNTAEITRSEMSSRKQSCGRNLTKIDSSFDDCQRILPPDCVDGSLAKINSYNVCNEGCDARESFLEDFERYKVRDAMPSSSSIQCNACIDNSPSSGSARQDNSQELSGLVKPSDGSSRRLTRSQTCSHGKETYQPATYNENPSFECKMSISDYEDKSAEELQNTSGQSVPHCFGTHEMLHGGKDGNLVMANELCLLDHVDKCGPSNSNYSKPSGGLESEVVPSPSDSFVYVESKQFELKENVEHNVKAFTFGSGKKLSFILHDSDASLDKGIFGGNNQPSSCKQSPVLPGISSKVKRAHRDSSPPDVLESPSSHVGNFGPVIGSALLNAFKETSEAELNSRCSEVQNETHNLLSNLVDISDIEIPPVELHRLESSLGHCMEQGDCNDEASDKGQLISTPECKDSVLSYDHNSTKDPSAKSCSRKKPETNPTAIAMNEIQQCPGSQSQALSCPKVKACNELDSSHGNDSLERPSTIRFCGEKSSLNRRSRHARIESWPQVKRRKIDRQQDHVFATSQSFPVTKPHPLKRDHGITYPKTLEIDIDTDFVEDVDKTTDGGICLEVNTNLKEGIQSATLSQHGEGGSCYLKKNEHDYKLPIINDEVETTSRLAMKESRNSQGCFIDGTRSLPLSSDHLNARMSGVRECSQNLCILKSDTDSLSSERLDRSSSTLHKETQQSPKWEDGLHEQYSVLPSSHEDMQHTDVDQSMLVSGGFIVDTQTNTDELDFAADGFDLGELELSRTTLERASILAEICSSASLDRSFSYFSSPSKVQETTNICRSLSDDARMSGDKQCGLSSCNLESSTDNLSSKNLNPSSTMHKNIQSAKLEEDLPLQNSIHSLSNEDLQLTDVDQSRPVFEGFIVKSQTDTDELDTIADGFDLGELELPKMTLERASILAEICRSASFDRPSSHFSSAVRFQETTNLCKSLSDDRHLDRMEFGNSSSSADYSDALHGMPYSVSLAYSSERYGWDSRNQPLSPVGKLWNRLSTHTGSSGKCSTSNPELTCFPIEEDPNSSEESIPMEENTGDTLNDTDSSSGNRCDKRQPLTNLTNTGTNPPMLVSAEEEAIRTDSLDFLRQKISVTGTQEKANLVPKYQCRKMSETIVKQTSCIRTSDGSKRQFSSIGQNAIKKAKDSVSNSISKHIVSNKTSLKGQEQKLSLREPRRNIVSNVSSFIPLIQQKQAAATCKGKRDVKVKALEAAEALKRLQEKTDNDRKRKKEELKRELEQKKLKQVELEKKKKEEERKKKDADNIAKKRQRDEDEKKEKEKKKMRIECGQRQREHNGKNHVERTEKESQQSKDDQMNNKKEFNNESKRPQNRETTEGEAVDLQKTDTNLTLNEAVMNYEERVTSGLSCDAEVMHLVEKSPSKKDLIVQKIPEKSYDISPYQCSDDEDEEDDELPTKKYIPSWTSRSSIALLLPLKLKSVDADVIFPPDSSCSVDEVLQPRTLRVKQVAA